MANSVDPDQTAPIGAVCSVFKLFDRSSPFCVQSVCFYLEFVRNAKQLLAADNFR